MDLKKLRENMPYKWRVQQVSYGKASCVAYVDSRQVQDKLDEVVGPENWQDDYKVINDNLYAGIGIKIKSDKKSTSEWVWKWDCGTESNVEKQKGESSDAFKRAAVKWGIARFLYSMKIQKINVDSSDKKTPVDGSGKKLYGPDQLSAYINSITKSTAPKSETETTTPAKSSNLTKDNKTKYEKTDGNPDYKKPDSPKWSTAVQERAGKIIKDGLTGADCLRKYIPNYNESNKTNYKLVSDFKDDKLLGSLMDFIDGQVPTDI